MGYVDAVNDGVRIQKNLYFPKCHICGKEVKSMSYIKGVKYTCKSCKLENKLADKGKRTEQDFEKKERKFENAVKRIEKRSSLKPYKEAIEKVHKKLHTDGYFDSTEEIMVAIELLKNGVKFIHQKKIKNYRLDFVLPEEKVVLEVDGTLFHNQETEKREMIRDDLIILTLGTGWEVIRISDKMINENIKKLIPAIRKIKEKRQEVRKQNNGCLPDWYSRKAT